MANNSQLLPEALASGRGTMSVPLSLLLASVVVFVLIYLRLRQRPALRLPPGPPGLPILGNMLQLKGHLWLKLAEMARTYGPVVHVRAFGQHLISLNTMEAAFDLLDEKAAFTSDRSDLIMVQLMTESLWISAMPATFTWSRQRKALHTGLRSLGSSSEWLPKEAALLATNMLSSPNNWRKHFELSIHAASCGVAYGNTLNRDAMPGRAARMNGYFQHMVAGQTPGTYIVELLPWLNLLPKALAPWKEEAAHIFRAGNNLLQEMYKEASASPDMSQPCVRQTIEDSEDLHNLTPLESVWLSGQVALAGVTNQGPLSFWLMAMILYPETQKRAQEELDTVVGRQRPPTWEDYQMMPYLQAMVREVFRWRATSPLGLTHVASKDIEYNGYTIPKGAVMLPNIWAINRSPSIYGADAEEFNPSRFIDPHTNQLLPPVANTKGEGQVVFGFGRRICPGRSIANRLVANFIFTLLWALKIEPAEGPGEHRAWDPNDCIDEGVFIGAPNFPCRTTERFEGALKVLESVQ
ncbi:cytochrome P450 [Trichoderma chlorosporum]